MSYASNAKGEVSTTRLQGFRLYVIWIIMLVVLLPAFIVFILTSSIYITDIQHICSAQVCNPGQLTIAHVHLLAAYNISPSVYADFNIAMVMGYSVLCLLVCTLLLRYKYNDWMALFAVLLCALSLACNQVIARFLIFHADAIIYAFRTFAFLQVILIAWFYALFPTGRFVPLATRWVLIVFTFLMTLLYTLVVWLRLPAIFSLVGAFALFYCCMACVLLSQVYRYRFVSSPIERQQTKWIFFSLTIYFVEEIFAYAVAYLFPTSFINLFNSTIELLALAFLTFSVVIAILRYRLWDVDIIINRTLVYGSLTAILALLYFCLVFLLQIALNPLTHNSGLAVVASTLIVAALFQPLRTRIQRVIDRRFYRSKYNATQTIANFSTVLRNEVELDQLTTHLVSVIDETMQPTHISLWLYKPNRQK